MIRNEYRRVGGRGGHTTTVNIEATGTGGAVAYNITFQEEFPYVGDWTTQIHRGPSLQEQTTNEGNSSSSATSGETGQSARSRQRDTETRRQTTISRWRATHTCTHTPARALTSSQRGIVCGRVPFCFPPHPPNSKHLSFFFFSFFHL